MAQRKVKFHVNAFKFFSPIEDCEKQGENQSANSRRNESALKTAHVK